MAHPGGRPTDYTPDAAKRLCELIATTPKSIRNICDQNEDMPSTAGVFRWMHKFPEFREQYLVAKETQGVLLTETMLATAYDCAENNEAIAKQNLVFRVLQWHLSKLAPKQFGDKKEIKQEMNLTVHEDKLKELE